MRHDRSPRTARRPSPGHALEVAGLRKSFGDHTALDGLDLVLPEGTILALIGPNGSGKTTTVRILSTLLQPDAGQAWVGGHDVVAEPDAVRGVIGVTGQFSAVDDLLTGRENLALMADLQLLGRIEGRRRADELLARFELGDAAARPAAGYSGGMRRRLDLAMTLMGRPRIIFLDEPTTGLDPRGRRVVWRNVRELAGEGVSVLLTTQYLDEADRLADQVTLIDRGKVVASGTPAAMKARAPGDRIRLWFADEDSLGVALGLFAAARRGDDGVSLVLANDGGVPALRHVLDALERRRLAVEGISAQPADLDDVFLSLTGAGRESADVDAPVGSAR